MKYMFDNYNANSDKVDFQNSIFNQNVTHQESSSLVDTEGFLSESAQENILKTSIKERNKLKLHENYIKDGMKKVLANVLFKPFYNSIYVDESFKSKYKQALFKELLETISSLNPDIFDTYNQLRKKSDFLSEVCCFCLEEVKKKENKTCEETEEFPDEFQLDEELIDDIDNYIENNDDLISLDQMVKEKVVDTIAKEKEKNEEEQKIMDDVVAESVIIVKNPDKALDEYSLFKSFVINSYKTALKEGAEEYFSINEKGERKVNMDMILAEAVVKYTLHEFLHTANIKVYSGIDIKRLCEDLVYNV